MAFDQITSDRGGIAICMFGDSVAGFWCGDVPCGLGVPFSVRLSDCLSDWEEGCAQFPRMGMHEPRPFHVTCTFGVRSACASGLEYLLSD